MRRSPPRPPAPAPRILVVDDSEDARYVYATYLRHVGYRVVTAADGYEAIDQARKFLPEVIVMDLTMPALDGWAATRAIKADPELRHMCVIAVTGHAFKGAEQVARDAGCDHYLIKPCLPEDLAGVIADILTRRGRPQRPPAS